LVRIYSVLVKFFELSEMGLMTPNRRSEAAVWSASKVVSLFMNYPGYEISSEDLFVIQGYIKRIDFEGA
jgi:hypothetical protein